MYSVGGTRPRGDGIVIWCYGSNVGQHTQLIRTLNYPVVIRRGTIKTTAHLYLSGGVSYSTSKRCLGFIGNFFGCRANAFGFSGHFWLFLLLAGNAGYGLKRATNFLHSRYRINAGCLQLNIVLFGNITL